MCVKLQRMRNGRDVIRFTRFQYRPDLLGQESGVETDMFAVDVGEIWVSASSDTAFRRGTHAATKKFAMSADRRGFSVWANGATHVSTLTIQCGIPFASTRGPKSFYIERESCVSPEYSA